MNWGHGIVLAIIGFVAVIVTMVVISVRMTGIELVTEDYYEQEINYQSRIDQQTSTNQLSREVITFDGQAQALLFDLPEGTQAKLELFRPSDETLDQELNFEVTSTEKMSVSVDQLKSGYWKVMLHWEEGGVKYYEEMKITI